MRTVEASTEAVFKCLTSGPYTGAGYGFGSRERNSRRSLAIVIYLEAEDACSTYQRPDTLETGDGQRFPLVSLSDVQVSELVEQSAKGYIASDYQKFKILG